jgi:hypothetical protein
MNWKTTISSFVLVVTIAARANAGDPPPPRSDDAAAEKQRGDQAMDALRFDEALEAYTHSYELGRDPAVLYNRGRLYQARSDYPKALQDLETFERDAPPALRAKVPKLAELIADVRSHVATLTLKCNVAGARVLIRGKDVGTTPLDALRINAGPAKIEISSPDHAPYVSETSLLGGSSTTLDVALVAKEAMGTLVVSADGPATIVVDGEQVGVAPVEVLRMPGTHKVVIKRAATDDVETSAVLVAGARREVHFDAPPKKPLTSQWWFWAGTGAIVVGAAVTIFFVSRTEKSPADGDGFSPSRVSGPLKLAW